jgi:hypothetical protein
VFESVAGTEASSAGMPDTIYRYEPGIAHALEIIEELPPREFVARVFDDVLDSVEDPLNYQNKYSFDKHVFQKFIALMFVNYATTDQQFYGTSKEDYGVASEKEMQDTPLYRAVGDALRRLEKEYQAGLGIVPEEFQVEAEPKAETLAYPNDRATEQRLVGSFTFIAEGVRVLKHVEHPQALEAAEIIGRASRELFRQLRELGIISPVALDPVQAMLE